MSLNVYSELFTPFVSILPDTTGSVWGTLPLTSKSQPNAGNRFLFGVIDGISYRIDTPLGVRVMFDSEQAILVTQGGVENYICTEAALVIKENELPLE